MLSREVRTPALSGEIFARKGGLSGARENSPAGINPSSVCCIVVMPQSARQSFG
jgi:hypothetical protein